MSTDEADCDQRAEERSAEPMDHARRGVDLRSLKKELHEHKNERNHARKVLSNPKKDEVQESQQGARLGADSGTI